ncbi:MAG TPA: hypothetical protein VGW78_00445 [Candidatus Babeliales bacterium]|jgi:hypothetical protein|nr:hypothetical protein [Candidatus Babeliales bacterium]
MKLYIRLFNVIFLFISILSFAQAPKQMTQSEAHMSVPLIQNMVKALYNLEENPYYQELFNQVVEKERQFNNTHYVFYNAFSNEWRVPQDLYLELYKRLHPLTINIEDFRTFRWIPVTHQTPKEFLKREMIEYGLVNDNEPRIKAYLLSTNLALFGNVGFAGECTFEYYLNAKSNTPVSESVFKGILDIFDNPSTYKEGETPILYSFLPEITELNKYLVVMPLPNGKEPQTLSQIFIPKNLVDTVAYVAWVQGNPYDEKLVTWVETHIQKRPGQAPIFAKSAPFLQEIRDLFKDVQISHPLFKKILEGIEQGKYNISTILNEYKTTPEYIPGLNNMQARLILSPQYIGNPSANVKIFTYDRLDKDKFAQYNQKLNELADNIVSTFLEYNAKRGPQWQPSEPKPAAKPVVVPQKPQPAPAARGRGRY